MNLCEQRMSAVLSSQLALAHAYYDVMTLSESLSKALFDAIEQGLEGFRYFSSDMSPTFDGFVVLISISNEYTCDDFGHIDLNRSNIFDAIMDIGRFDLSDEDFFTEDELFDNGLDVIRSLNESDLENKLYMLKPIYAVYKAISTLNMIYENELQVHSIHNNKGDNFAIITSGGLEYTIGFNGLFDSDCVSLIFSDVVIEDITYPNIESDYLKNIKIGLDVNVQLDAFDPDIGIDLYDYSPDQLFQRKIYPTEDVCLYLDSLADYCSKLTHYIPVKSQAHDFIGEIIGCPWLLGMFLDRMALDKAIKIFEVCATSFEHQQTQTFLQKLIWNEVNAGRGEACSELMFYCKNFNFLKDIKLTEELQRVIDKINTFAKVTDFSLIEQTTLDIEGTVYGRRM
jgi:hypothetical protein